MYVKYTEEMIRDAVSHSESLAGAIRYLGIRWSGGQQILMRQRIAKFGIDCTHFTGQGHRKGKRDAKRLSADQILVRSSGSHRREAKVLRRALEEIGRPYVCVGCGVSSWRDQPLILEVHHIDGEWLNNLRENLEYQCPNCHSQARIFQLVEKQGRDS